MFALKLILSVVSNVLFFGIPLFALAGTWHWDQAWVFLAIIAVLSAITMIGLSHGHQEIIKERLKSPLRAGQPLSDKIVVILLIASMLAAVSFIPLDVFRFHLLPAPPIAVSFPGLLVFILGWWLEAETLRENKFAAAAVRLQKERGHHVIDSGVYGVVRHPLYAGFFLVLIGLPLWLQSYAGVIAAAVPMAILVIRINLEERFLLRELPGYADYREKVRFRLVPHLW